MSRWTDRLLLGPVRRRRRMNRRLRALEREYAAWASAGPVRSAGRPARDRTAWVAFAITLAAVASMVVAVPDVLPASVRGLAGLGPERLARVPNATGKGTFAFSAHQPGDPSKPVAYNPCREVLVRINPDGGPSDAVALVQEALADVGEATGLVFRYDGTTPERPNWESATVPSVLGSAQAPPVLVSWATSDEVRQLDGDVAGIGGSVSMSFGDGVVRYVTGGVTLDADAFERIAAQPDGAAEMRAIVLHELGHVVGLGHVNDAGELMNGDNVGLLDFGGGDRRGLAALGAGSCV
jgi:hypothetical protein